MKLQSWARPPAEGKAPEEGSQPAAELVWQLQSAPALVLQRALRLTALSPSHTLGTRAGGFPLTQQFRQVLNTHTAPYGTEAPGGQKGTRPLGCSKLWAQGARKMPGLGSGGYCPTPILTLPQLLAPRPKRRTEKTLKNQIIATHWGSARPEILSGSLGAVASGELKRRLTGEPHP